MLTRADPDVPMHFAALVPLHERFTFIQLVHKHGLGVAMLFAKGEATACLATPTPKFSLKRCIKEATKGEQAQAAAKKAPSPLPVPPDTSVEPLMPTGTTYTTTASTLAATVAAVVRAFLWQR